MSDRHNVKGAVTIRRLHCAGREAITPTSTEQPRLGGASWQLCRAGRETVVTGSTGQPCHRGSTCPSAWKSKTMAAPAGGDASRMHAQCIRICQGNGDEQVRISQDTNVCTNYFKISPA
eukprot:gnl/TRDRNA2_/TRDRNA2_171303_c0_seq1.p1 gnl/TRDRNA2_/TRDRNA2_171303_c0~~gnl/TRDRNA2_/TRDRNA2_171303_c0_seq1.p1  ORF type:complete len:119 (-),score=17.13 gnl/TRDRNA2_/TRDRNA2_171303_c0_seq1:45-401(-)